LKDSSPKVSSSAKPESLAVTLERLSANQSNVKNHDEASSDYSSTNYREYYAIIMAYAPKLYDQIKDQDVRNRIKRLVCEPVKYMEEEGGDQSIML
jgi:hypothetical protein